MPVPGDCGDVKRLSCSPAHCTAELHYTTKEWFHVRQRIFDSPDIILDVETQLLNAAFQVKQNLQPTLILTLLMKIILPCNWLFSRNSRRGIFKSFQVCKTLSHSISLISWCWKMGLFLLWLDVLLHFSSKPWKRIRLMERNNQEFALSTFTWACLDFLSFEFQHDWPDWMLHKRDKPTDRLCVQRTAGQGKGALLQGSAGQNKKLESSSTARERGTLDWGKDSYISTSTEHWDTLQGLKCQSFKNILSKYDRAEA